MTSCGEQVRIWVPAAASNGSAGATGTGRRGRCRATQHLIRAQAIALDLS